MVNFLETLYVLTAVAVMTVIYSAVRGLKTELDRLRFKGGLWMSGIGIVSCALLYWYLS